MVLPGTLLHEWLLLGPLTIVGNALENLVGYIVLSIMGPVGLPVYNILRNLSNAYPLFIILVSLFGLSLVVLFIKYIASWILDTNERKILFFGATFFVIALLPFLPLEYIASRYSYLSEVGFVLIVPIFFKKIYDYLIKNNDKYTAISCIVFIVIIFCMVHLFQQQKLQIDWQASSEKSERFLISLNEHYIDQWSKDPMHFYFINVPIYDGNAFVFPSGLDDAVWFVLQNPKVRITTDKNLSDSLDAVEQDIYANVFEFDSDGGIKEVIRVESAGKIILQRK